MSESKNLLSASYVHFLEDLKSRVASSRAQAARSVNKELILLYHHIGMEILRSQQQHGWGAKIIDQLSNDLRSSFPEMKGFSPRNLKYMRKFAQEYPDAEFVQQLVAQLPWGKPMGLVEYKRSEVLPENLITALSSIKELKAELENIKPS